MEYQEKYEFDLNGFLYLKNLLSESEVAALLEETNRLEIFFQQIAEKPANAMGQWNLEYRLDTESAASVYKYDNPGTNIVVDDFISSSTVFEILVGHARTMHYVNALIMEPAGISSTELRYRYKGSQTTTHMGGPMDVRNAYRYIGAHVKKPTGGGREYRDIDLLCLRVLYALHDLPVEQGPLSVVPGSHKSNLASPYGNDPQAEPGMIPIPMRAGDAIIFTENIRHGGFINQLDQTRKTIHITYNQNWMGSESPVHYNKAFRLKRKTWERFSQAQREFFPYHEIIE